MARQGSRLLILGCLVLLLTTACGATTHKVAGSARTTPTATQAGGITPRPTPTPAATATPLPSATATNTPPQPAWSVYSDGAIVHVSYGAVSVPEYAALHLTSGYFRLNSGPPSGWGTSVIILPSFWSATACGAGGYCQGAPVQASWQTQGADLLLDVSGSIGGLAVHDVIQLHPPANGMITAAVTSSVQGSVALSTRPGEAYKPFMLSSMHISDTQWDAQQALAGTQSYSLPGSQWIISPTQSITAQSLGLLGGTSAWKAHAPTVTIAIDRALQICGWVTASSDPNDENIGYWAASDVVIPYISYTINATAT